ncbi:hypothetical protein R1flu_022892 [Riccia fluitans]|uniref:Uncharacterized protein n=1 Tax=Riccia fluitans TaxID=41844 RepID=A0ABD1XR05_9MARC
MALDCFAADGQRKGRFSETELILADQDRPVSPDLQSTVNLPPPAGTRREATSETNLPNLVRGVLYGKGQRGSTKLKPGSSVSCFLAMLRTQCVQQLHNQGLQNQRRLKSNRNDVYPPCMILQNSQNSWAEFPTTSSLFNSRNPCKVSQTYGQNAATSEQGSAHFHLPWKSSPAESVLRRVYS